MSTTIKTCPACGADTAAHCDSRTCNWWRCTRCLSYGNADRHHRNDGTRGAA